MSAKEEVSIMRKTSAILLGLSVAILGLSGCKNSSEDTAYDQVGDVRVFDTPRREVAARNNSSLWNESVPAPKPMASRKIQKLDNVSRSFVSVGDLELE